MQKFNPMALENFEPPFFKLMRSWGVPTEAKHLRGSRSSKPLRKPKPKAKPQVDGASIATSRELASVVAENKRLRKQIAAQETRRRFTLSEAIISPSPKQASAPRKRSSKAVSMRAAMFGG